MDVLASQKQNGKTEKEEKREEDPKERIAWTAVNKNGKIRDY